VVLAAGGLLRGVAWTAPEGKPISVRLLQGNVPQNLKFAPEEIDNTLALYHRMITEKPADLIATPETAIPMLSSRLPPDYLGLLDTFLAQHRAHLVLGIPVSSAPHSYANSVLGLPPGAPVYRYDKHHLVPFGEFIPLGFRWFVDMMRIPLGDFTPGATIQPAFSVNGQRVLPNICYEDLFGEEIAKQIARDPAPATMLLNVSNIAWFGDSIALPQHLQISQMRSLETGRPMLRATNTGATAIVDPAGRVVAQLAPFRQGALDGTVQGYGGLTPYIRLGNAGVVGLALLLLASAWIMTRRKGSKGASGG
ncbi:apolipoprotein N-acyltransferase, partial [Oxalobacteraceae bacterium OM1]